jgi:adenine-specific DNA-methyltransferase
MTPAAEQARRRKELGAFYTPPGMAAILVEWAIRTPSDRALDPSFGGLVFLEAAAQRLRSLGAERTHPGEQLWGIDLDGDAYAGATSADVFELSHAQLLHQDFFEVTPGLDLPLVEAVVGNPPYIRYQGWDGAKARELSREAGVNLSRMASSWAPFLVHATHFVAPGGRLAMVLPAEALHAQYANEVLQFLGRSYERLRMAVFQERMFPGALEEVVLLFAEGRTAGSTAGVEVIPCRTLTDVQDAISLRRATDPRPAPIRPGKLIAQLLPEATQRLYEQLQVSDDVRQLGDLASVDIGAVTGANDFFLLDDTKAQPIPDELLRLTVSKAVHLQGARLHADDVARLRKAGHRLLLFLATSETPDGLLEQVGSYLRRGRRAKVHRRYKCRVRTPWWAVPIPRAGVPDLLLTYCSNQFPRLVVNEARALHTNTVHAVTVLAGTEPGSLAAAFPNSLTMLSAELVGRSYGGGVLKLEPTEAEALLLPPTDGSAARLVEVDRLIRLGDMEGALDLNDSIVLGERLGLSAQEQRAIRLGAQQLRERRRARGKAPS